ncbi:DUF2818 family protein [Candidatus Pandoraea novymonadis]|nr:DUF2818 family protein [Candidatus Pandoraea novymonadis]
MSVSTGSALVILIALLGANLPFLNQRLFAIFRIDHPIKPLRWRLMEMVATYFGVGLLAFLVESFIGDVFIQGWEFYVTTVSLFAVFAFPGFAYRYLSCRRHLM